MSTEFFNDQWRIPSNENQNKVSNYSMEFDGASTTNVNVGNLSAIQGTSTFSISAWVNLDNTGQQRIFGSWEASVSKRIVGFGVHTGSRLLLQVSNDGVSFDQLLSTSTLTANTWTHVVVTFSNGVANFYINGASAGSDTSTTVTNIYNVSNDYFIGSFQSSTTIPFGGKMDQLTIFDYALSQDQVTQLGAEGYVFNFNSSRIRLNSTSILQNVSSFTISAWAKRIGGSNDRMIFGSDASGNRGLYISARGSGQYKVLLSTNGSTNDQFIYSTGGADNVWRNIIVNWNGTSINLFIDGVFVYTQAVVNSTGNFSMPVEPSIGSQNGTTSGFGFIGEISNVQIWDSILTSGGATVGQVAGGEIATIYNNSYPLKGTPPQSSNLKGWWRLDDTATFNSGTSVWSIPDASTNSNNGTSVGMDASSLVASNIYGELMSNPMALSPKPVAYYQLGDQSVSTGPTTDYLVPNNSLSDYVFDFNTDRIDISSSGGSFLNGATKLTVSIWVNLDASTGGDYYQIFAGNWVNPGWQFKLQFIRYGSSLGPRIQFSVRTVNGGVPSAATAQRSFDPAGVGWFNITGTWDGSLIKVYTNGVVGGTSAALTGTINNSNETIELGGQTGTSFNLNGKLSNVAIWKNTALTQPEVTEVYNNGAPLNLNNFSGSAPAALYKLNASEIFNNTSTEWSIDNNAYPSVYNSSLNFNGTNFITAPTTSFGAGDLAVSLWFNQTAGTGYQGMFAGSNYQTNNGNEGFIIYANNTGIEIWYQTASNVFSNIFTLPSVYVLNSWKHVCLVREFGVGWTIYLDGVVAGTNTTSGSKSVGLSSPISAIGRNFNTNLFFNGEISNVSTFNTNLLSADVQTLYNNGTPASDISSLSPVSWWKLDNTTTGLIDNGSASNNGTNNGATEYAGFVNALAGESVGMTSANLITSDLQQTSGYSPYALDFSGITAHLKTYTIPAATNTVTLSAWVKRTGASGSYAGVFGVRNSGGSPDFGLCWQLCFFSTDNKIQFRTSSGVGYNYILTTVTQNDVMPDNTWTHVVGVADGTNIKIYINGVLQTDIKTQTDGTLQTPTSNILFAAQGPSGSQSFNGQLSNCARWNIGLTQAEVTEIYNQGVPSNLNNFSGTTPIGWWQLGSNSSFEGNDWTCLDEIGTDYADSGTTAMANDDITNGPGYSANGLGTSSIDIVGDAPYSTANGLSENMDVLDRTIDVPG